MIMLTLSVRRGKEKEAEEKMHNLKKSVLEGSEVISGGKRKAHYHVLSKDDIDLDRIAEKWPGIIKKHEITEAQARHIRKYH